MNHFLLNVIADGGTKNNGPDFGKASPFGLLIVLVLLIGTFALVWSMNRHLRKLPESFDPAHPEPDQAVDDGTVGGVPHEAPTGDAGPDGTTKPETG